MQSVNPRIQQGAWQPGDVLDSSASLFVRISYPRPERSETIFTTIIFGLLLIFHAWGVSVGWDNRALPGNEFRQTQTAVTALFIQRTNDFSLAYPTPVLGKPWSVPFEFPLYQWSVVWLSNVTHLSLTHAGRAVSIACFYLTLPAAWLLLGRLGVIGTRRLIVLGMMLTCPLYIFYARAFLIETMALMFSLWFLYAFVAGVERRSWIWLAIANVAGTGAGLVKITTFVLYLIPVGIWSLWWLWTSRPRKGAGWLPGLTTAGWIAAATAIPFAASYWWIGFTDGLRFLNPSSRNLVSASLKGYTLGTWQARLSPDTWDSHWRILSHDLVSLTALVTAVLLALLFAGRWRRWIGCCLGLFVAAPATFPILYAWHEYYFVANAVLLMAAMGLVLCGVLESATPRWIAWIIIVGLYAGQAAQYLDYHYAIQHRTHGGSTELYQTLRAVTEADDVLIIAGEDWNPTTPFYAQRRALMIRRSMENDGSYLREAFGRLKGEKVTALILNGAQRDNRTLQELATQCFDIDPKPAFTWMNVTVYLHRALRVAAVDYIRHQPFIDLGLADKLESESSPIARREMPVSALLPAQQQLFRGMSPQPARFYTTYGLNLDQVNGRWFFNSHPDSRLWFKVPAGLHEISAEYYMFPGAYDGLDRNAATDGVEFAIYEQKADGSKRQIFDRLLNPVDNWDDRLIQKAVLTVEVAPGAELLFETGPGTRGNYNRDWAAWGQITIK